MKDTVDIETYSEMLRLQESLNEKLRHEFEAEKKKGRDHLAQYLVARIDQLIEELNANGHDFKPASYSGDIYYENSEQWWSNGKEMGEGIVLHFHGFSVQASWEGKDKYA